MGRRNLIVLVLCMALAGCRADIPNKPKTADVSWVKAELSRRHGRDFDVSLKSGKNGGNCAFSVYDRDNDFYFTEVSYTNKVKPFSAFGVEVYKNERFLSDNLHTAKMYKQAADKYGCEYSEMSFTSPYGSGGGEYTAYSVLVKINGREEVQERLKTMSDIVKEPEIKYLRIKLNYGEFVHSEPLFCLYAEQPEQFSADTGGEKCFFFYKDMQAQDGLTEEEFLNMTADELEAWTKG